MEVYLAIYDLSHGMARGLSAQFLGPNHSIEMIPHTGIVVYGKEYYFGGGIQKSNPHEFRRTTNLQPVQILFLGRTHVEQEQFERWCVQQQQPQSQQQQQQQRYYSIESYDLFHNNCNHFSHDAVRFGLKLPSGVPDWILQVPQRVLASPIGQQLLRPMLEQMQITGPMGTANDGMRVGTTTSPGTCHAHNPWAHLSPPSNSTFTATPTTPSVSNDERNTSNELPPSSLSFQRNKTPLLDHFWKPLLSNDTQTVPISISKLSNSLTTCGVQPQQLEQVHDGFQKLQTLLTKQPNTTTATFKELDAIVTKTLLQLLQQEINVTFVLLLLRSVVLLPNALQDGFIQECLEWIVRQLQNQQQQGESPLASTSARSLAYCTLGNVIGAYHPCNNHTATATQNSNNNTGAFGKMEETISSILDLETLVDYAVRDLDTTTASTAREVTQAASSFLYNLVLLFVLDSKTKQSSQKETNSAKDDKEELSDILVSILCALVEGVIANNDNHNSHREDPMTQFRKLLIISRIVVQPAVIVKKMPMRFNVNTAAKTLLVDLGFLEHLQEIISSSAPSNNDEYDIVTAPPTIQYYQVTRELASVLTL